MHDSNFTPRPWRPDPAGEPVPPPGQGDWGDADAPEPVGPPPATVAVPADGASLPGRLVNIFLPLAAFLTVLLLMLYAMPVLLNRWRLADAEAEAEAAYLKRRAELRAEAEAAEEHLKLLDRRLNLVSLGFREVVRKVTPTVVNVACYRDWDQAGKGDVLNRSGTLFDPEQGKSYLLTGVGSGVLFRPGVVLTNHHVVKDSGRLRVTFASGQSVTVEPDRVDSDPLTDLAVLRLPADAPAAAREDYAFAATFADSDKVERGDLVLALGSPFGLKQTVTHGVISAKGRLLTMLDMVELLQTDASINPGNSGGPLFDQYGRVVGINVAIASETGGNQGIGFAIPANTALSICDDLLAKGEVSRGFIGIEMDDVPPGTADRAGLGRHGGVLVKGVLPGFPAAEAGLQPGDVILQFNQTPLPVSDPVQFFRQRILEAEVGHRVPLEIFRDGERQVVMLAVGRRPERLSH